VGSVIAVGYAAGLSPQQMTEQAGRTGTRWKAISALTISLYKPGFLRLSRLLRALSPLGPDGVKTFDELHLPCSTVATDIESGERVAIQAGPLDMAFRASCSLPMVVSPLFYQEKTLVDGGMVDPVPAEVVKAMGADICIAVNVVPPLKKGVETVLSRTYRQANRLNPISYLSTGKNRINRFDRIMNSFQVLGYELGNFKAISADVRINPDLSAHTWIEVYKPMPFIEKGADATKQALPEIRRVISERLAEAQAC
jgi:NTE family protein